MFEGVEQRGSGTGEIAPAARVPASPFRRLFDRPAAGPVAVLGVLPGEGIGPEVIAVALQVLHAVQQVSAHRFEVVIGGAIGLAAERDCRRALSPDVMAFIRDVFARGGCVLAGAGGGRFVYDARRALDLFCKINPLVPAPALRGIGRLRPETLEGIDIVVIRENRGGVYQGRWSDDREPTGGRVAHHSFSYTEEQVRRILNVAARLAAQRRGLLTLVTKPYGVPTISRLWSQCAGEIARQANVQLRELEIDYAAFLLVQEPGQFDVLVTPNLFGDILCDLGGVLLGSRGLCYGGSFTPTGEGIFQTNHGAALDLAGTDRANPAAQVLALAMALRDGLGFDHEADLIASALSDVWARGYRTDDLAEKGCKRVGTREMGEHIAEAVGQRAASGA